VDLGRNWALAGIVLGIVDEAPELRLTGGLAGDVSLSSCFANSRANLRAPSWPASCVPLRAPPQEIGEP